MALKEAQQLLDKLKVWMRPAHNLKAASLWHTADLGLLACCRAPTRRAMSERHSPS